MAKRSIRKNSFKGGRTKKKKDKKKNSFKKQRKVKFDMGYLKKDTKNFLKRRILKKE